MSIEVQSFSVEVESVDLLERYLRVAMETVLTFCEESAVKIIEPSHLPSLPRGFVGNRWNRLKGLPVIAISGWFRPGEGNGEANYFGGRRPWQTFDSTEAAIQSVKKLLQNNFGIWETEFHRKFGNGITKRFNSDDGDGAIATGLRLEMCGDVLPEQIAVSLVHFYYPNAR